MTSENETVCPNCGGELKYYSKAKRIKRKKYGAVDWTKVWVLCCEKCGSYHRALPNTLLPYKQYDARIIRGVVNGIITSDDLDYETYPSEMTMHRWLAEFTNDSVFTSSES